MHLSLDRSDMEWDIEDIVTDEDNSDEFREDIAYSTVENIRK